MRKENQIDVTLFCESDIEECFELDEKNIGFQEYGFEKLESKKCSNPFEVILEPQKMFK